MNLLYILLALFIFGLLIFIHELGHFIVARLCGVKILEFAIGMGPKLISWRSKKTQTAYSLRLFPIGGFVSMLGENGMEAVQGEQPEGAPQTPDPERQENSESPENGEFFVNSLGEEQKNPQEQPATLSEEDAKHAYCNQSVWKRMLISLAGPLMNVLLGFLLMLVMVTMSGERQVGTTVVANFHIVYSAEEEYMGLKAGDYVIGLNGERLDSFASLKAAVDASTDGTVDLIIERWNAEGTDVERVSLDDVVLDATLVSSRFTASLSEQSGLMIGDEIIKVNGTRVHTAHELSYEIMNQGYRAMSLTVIRNGERLVLNDIIVPSYVDSGVTFGNMDFRIWAEERFNLPTILKHTWFRSCSTVKMVYDSLGGLFSGRYGVEAVSGPVGITKTISDAAKTGFLNILYLVIVISINLGIMNLLPFPALDGGHLLIYVIEVIRRKPMKKEVEGIINFLGLIILLALAIIISIKDVISL